MLAPQYNVRSLLALTALAALVGWITNQARAEAIWAKTILFVLVVFGFSFLMFGGLFLVTRILSIGMQMAGRHLPFATMLDQNRTADSPFAEHRPPPQLIQPEEPV